MATEKKRPVAVFTIAIVLAAGLGLAVGVVGALGGSKLLGMMGMAGGGPGGPGGMGGGPPEGMMMGPPPALVRVGSVEEMELKQRFSVVGRLREIRRATVSAEVSGKVLE
ncbi:MAG: hypothetical protein MI741_23655, partial [Rhodospirillales bacterium]|nr:hypothetical protein [Rhodospirillales bacterium]